MCSSSFDSSSSSAGTSFSFFFFFFLPNWFDSARRRPPGGLCGVINLDLARAPSRPQTELPGDRREHNSELGRNSAELRRSPYGAPYVHGAPAYRKLLISTAFTGTRPRNNRPIELGTARTTRNTELASFGVFIMRRTFRVPSSVHSGIFPSKGEFESIVQRTPKQRTRISALRCVGFGSSAQ